MSEPTFNIKQSLVLYYYHHSYFFKVAVASCKKTFKPRHIHDLRLSMKNLDALLELLHEIEPRKKRLPWYPDRLGKLFKVVGELRDVQVLRSELNALEKNLDVKFGGFRKIFMSQEKDLTGKLKPMLKVSKYLDELQGIKLHLEEVAGKYETEQQLEQKVLRHIRLSWRESCRMLKSRHTASNLHALRINLKHLYYILMVLRDKKVIWDSLPFNPKELNPFQELLGSWHDLVVFRDKIREILRQKGKAIPGHGKMILLMEFLNKEQLRLKRRVRTRGIRLADL
jgi:CHAD domain-containing protein